MIEHIVIAIVIAALVWWVLAKLVGPILVSSGAPFLTTLGNALVSGAALLGLVAGVLWYFGGPSIFGGR
jgi:hypothetical protein